MAQTKANPDHLLTKRDLAAVLNYLAEIKHKWIDIGIQLELDPEELEKRANNTFSAVDNMRGMLLEWLRGQEPIPTWRALSSALRMPAVNETRIASVIERERVFVAVSSQICSETPKTETQDKTMESTGAMESVASDEIAKVDKTNQEDSPISMEPVTVREPFPYLITSGLSLEEKDAYLERLMLESMDIRYRFCRLTSDTQISLQSRNVKIKKISDEVKSFHPHYHNKVFKYRAIDIPKAMGLLNESWNFTFYGVLEHIIVKLGTVANRVTLGVYKKSLSQYSKRRLFECPDGIFGGSKKEDEEEMVMKRANKGTSMYDITLGDVMEIVSEFRKEMKVEEFEMRLLSNEVEDNHMVLFFAVNSSLVLSKSLFPLTQEQKERLMACGIWHVSCGEFIFQHKPLDVSEIDGAGVSDEDQAAELESSREQSSYNKDPAMLQLRGSMSYKDDNIGSHTHLSVNNIRQVVEVSNTANLDTSYKSYKVGRYRRGILEWVSGTKGIRYGIGKFPKVALNDEGYVVEVDEEATGFISSRVGIVHPSNVMLWTEASTTSFAGSQPCVAICRKAVVITFIRNSDGYYCVGTLDTGDRYIQWSKEEHRFITGGITDMCIAINPQDQVAVVYTKSTLSAAVSPLYLIMGTVSHANQRISFSVEKASSQSFAAGIFPSIGLRDNSILVVYAQKNSVALKKIKYSIGLAEKGTTNSHNVKWAADNNTFDFSGERAAVAVNDKGVVIISHAQNRHYSCHIGRLYHETVI